MEHSKPNAPTNEMRSSDFSSHPFITFLMSYCLFFYWHYSSSNKGLGVVTNYSMSNTRASTVI